MSQPSAILSIDLAGFRAWLQGLGDGIAGVGAEACDCPLARFLRGQGRVGPWVGDDRVGFDHEARTWPLPGWARRFAALADGWAAGNGESRTIPARVALQLLDRASEVAP